MFVLANCRIGADNIEVITPDKAVKIEANNNIDSLVVVFNSSEKTAVHDASVMYNTINKVVKRVGHLTLVITDTYDSNAKMLGMLLAKNKIFNVFVVEDLLDIDEK